LPADAETAAQQESVVEKAYTEDQKAITELQARKQELTNELRSLEKALKTGKTGEGSVGGLPMNTNLAYSLYPDLDARCLAVRVEVTTDVQITSIIAVDLEGAILEGNEILAISPPSSSRTAVLPLWPTKYIDCKIRIQVTTCLFHAVCASRLCVVIASISDKDFSLQLLFRLTWRLAAFRRNSTFLSRI
jgi:Ciliary BBSome complex subunit 2, C-terminal